MDDIDAIIALLDEIRKTQESMRKDIKELKKSISELENIWSTTEEYESYSADAAEDELYYEARKIVVQTGKCSTSILQRVLSIGYGRASKLIDELETNGVIGPAEGLTPRFVFLTMEGLIKLEIKEREL